MVGKPSDTRLDVLVFIVGYMDNHRYAPTRDEIADAVGLSSRSSVQYHIETLVTDGFLERSTYRHRMIRPTDRGIAVVAELNVIDGPAST
jgi:SOS-response transcriptional repressor LexA